MMIQTLAARRTRLGCENLIALASAMPEDKRDWKPLDTGHSVNELLIECVLVNHKWGATLRNRAYTRFVSEFEQSIRAGRQTIEDYLCQSTAELVAAIDSIHDEELSEEIEAPFGTYSIADCCLIAYWNMTYHEGQIAYIQTLYGDLEFHTSF